MISPRSRSKEWIRKVTAADRDPLLVEKMIMSFVLVESLQKSGLNFLFKGGTSLSLVTGSLRRFSIDVDIIVPPTQDLDPFINQIVGQGIFTRMEEDERTGNLPVRHYKFYFSSAQDEERSILLGVLFDNHSYPKTIKAEIKSPLLAIDGSPTLVVCPNTECLLGDKLTAFAPHTTGVQYNKKKDLEIAKQLYDIAVLFDLSVDMDIVFDVHKKIVAKELSYRDLKDLSVADVLEDTFLTACMIGGYGMVGESKEYAEIISGVTKLRGYITSEVYVQEDSIISASKVAYLAALAMTGTTSVTRFDKTVNLSSFLIANPIFNKLNKLKRLNFESFHYYFQALKVLGWL